MKLDGIISRAPTILEIENPKDTVVEQPHSSEHTQESSRASSDKGWRVQGRSHTLYSQMSGHSGQLERWPLSGVTESPRRPLLQRI